MQVLGSDFDNKLIDIMNLLELLQLKFACKQKKKVESFKIS